ncbi:MAG: hypothetical protein Q7K39_00120, partial [Candidatus Magasanikbacteria bacterium]|nr:hypothetical protein [Candidatus Magasanikbacteria bacterium]
MNFVRDITQQNQQPQSWQHVKRLLFFVFSILFSLSLFHFSIFNFSVANAATAPALITYQGKMLNSSNFAITTTVAMKFVLYSAASGGTALYTASGTLPTTSTISITPTNGLFSVNLGDTGTNSLDPSIFQNNQTLYLEVTVAGETLSPRKQITASPFSFNSKYLDGVAATSTASTSTYIPISDSSGNFSFNNLTSTGLTVNGTSTLAAPIVFTSGQAVSSSAYWVGRDADAINQLHFNVPTGAKMEWSINDVSRLVMSDTSSVSFAFAQTATSTTGKTMIESLLTTNPSAATANQFLSLGALVTTAGAGFNHTGSLIGLFGAVTAGSANTVSNAYGGDFTVTQSSTGTTTNATGVRVRIQNVAGSTITTGRGLWVTSLSLAGTITNYYGILVDPATSPGTVTNAYGLFINNQSYAGGTISYAIGIASQTANAVTTRAINIAGTGVNNAIRLGGSANVYASTTNNIRFSDSTNARGLDFNLTAAGDQTITTFGGGDLSFGVTTSFRTTTISGITLMGTTTLPSTNYKLFIDSGDSANPGLGVNGYIKASGFITGTTTLDLAEQYPINPQCSLDNSCPEEGDAVCVVPGTIPATIEKCDSPYSKNAIGIVSTNPGFTLGGL